MAIPTKAERFKELNLISCALLLALFSFFVLVGWFIKNETLIRIRPQYVAMVFNTALSIFVLAGALISFYFRQFTLTRILSLSTLAFTFLTGAQYLLKANFGLDQLFFSYNLETPMQYPGRMALNTAVALGFSGLSIFLITLPKQTFYLVTALVLSALICSISLVSLFGYFTGLEAAAGWANFSRMAVHTAFCTAVLGFAVLIWIVLESLDSRVQFYAFPIAATLAILSGTLLVYQAFETRKFLSLKKIAEEQAFYLKTTIEDRLKENILALTRMAERWEALSGFPETLWNTDSSNYLKDLYGLESIEIFNENWDILQKNRNFKGKIYSYVTEEIKDQLAMGKTILHFYPENDFIAVFIPLKVHRMFKGALLSEINATKVFQASLSDFDLGNYLLEIKDHNVLLFQSGLVGKKIGEPLTRKIDFVTPSPEIQIYLTTKTLSLEKSRLSYFILIGGAIYSAFFPLLILVLLKIKEKKKIIEETAHELEIAAKKAEEAAIAKGLFLANMSHELRTPLNAIIGTVQLLGETEVNETQKRYVDRMIHSGKSLLNLINDILDFSKIESGTVQLNPSTFSLEKMIKATLQGLLFKAREKGIELVLDYPTGGPLQIEADPHRLGQIVGNLTNNSLKFTEKGFVLVRVIWKSVTSSLAQLRIEVEDTGIGIPEESQKSLFQKFSQVHTGLSSKFGGVGLGLSICKRLAEIMKGVIGVTSKPNQGSLFWVELPLPVKEMPSPPFSLASKKVLLLNMHTREGEVLSQLLQSWSLNVSQEKKGESYDFVICPEGTALEEKNLPLILVSDREITNLPEGALGYVTRPLIPSELIAILQKKQ